jgi:hypothetical protein
MKMFKCVCLGVVLSLVFGCASHDPFDKWPDLAPAAVSIQREITFDLRELFISERRIERLTKRGACLVFATMREKEQEVVIGKARTLNEIVRKVTHEDYGGQVKVVSLNSIVQTPLDTCAPHCQAEILVSPGDLVFIVGGD